VQTLVAETADEEVLHLSLCCPEAAFPCDAWCSGKAHHGAAEGCLRAARHTRGGTADVSHCSSCGRTTGRPQTED